MVKSFPARLASQPRDSIVARPITVIIPTYGRQFGVEQALQSIANQTEIPNEVIVVDDNSPEHIVIPERFNETLNIHLIRNEVNLGGAQSMNNGVKASKNEIIAILDSDDAYAQGYIEKIYSIWSKSPRDVGIVATSFYWCLDEFKPYRKQPAVKSELTRELLLQNGNVVGGTSVMSWRRSTMLEVGGFDSTRGPYDWIMMLRMLSRSRAVLLDAPLVYYTSPHATNDNMTRNYRRQVAALHRVFRIAGRGEGGIEAHIYHRSLLARMLALAGRRRRALKFVLANLQANGRFAPHDKQTLLACIVGERGLNIAAKIDATIRQNVIRDSQRHKAYAASLRLTPSER